MADGTVQVAPDSTGKKIDTSELTVGAQLVERQRIVLGDPTAPAGLASVQATAPVGTEQGLVTRPILPASVPVTGTFWQATQPVSIAAMPSTPVTGTFWQATQPVSGTFWQATQPISAAALPLPAGAAKETGGNLDAILAKLPSTPALEGGNLASIKSYLLPGQEPAATSVPVVLASDQAQDLLATGQGAQSTLGNNIMLSVAGAGSLDTMGLAPMSLRSFTCQIIGSAGISAGAVFFEGCNDNTNFIPLMVFDDAVALAVPIITAQTIAASTSRAFSGRTHYRYVRCRISTAFVGGTIQAFTRFSNTDYVPRVYSVNSGGTGFAANIFQVGGTATVNGGLAGTLAVGGNVAAGVAPTCNPIPLAIDTGGLSRRLLTDVSGTLLVAPAPTINGNAALTALNVNASGALTALKASQGNLYGFSILNNTASPVFLEFWNVAAGSVTLGTTTPTCVFCIPASGTLTVSPSDMALMQGAAAMSYAAVTAYNGATPASITGSIFFK